MYGNYKFLKFERRGLVLTVTIDNAPANAVNETLHNELSRVFSDIERDAECNVVVLTGAGRFFSGGGDLQQMLSNLDNLDRMAVEMTDAPRITQSLLSLSKPTIARVNGHAIGIGASLALLCDFVFAVDTAKISDPHVLVGLAAGDGGSLIWPHLLGLVKARHYLFTGEPITGAEAQAAGMIHASLPSDELDDAVYAYADKLAALPLMALSATKRSVNMALARQALADSTNQIGLETLTMLTADHNEALRAMTEKRAPVFKHGRV